LLEFAANVRQLGDPVRDIQHQPIAVGGTDWAEFHG
jgi:hypothetical protein